MSKRREDKTRYWVKPPGSAQQPETWRPVGPLTLKEIAKNFDWDCEVLKEGKNFAAMRSSAEWQPLSAICPENPKEVLTDDDFLWKKWWRNCAGKAKYWVKPPGSAQQPETWRPVGPLTLKEIAKNFDWDCEVLKEGKNFAAMRSSAEWQPLSAICPESPKEVFTEEDFLWKEWWKNCAGKKFVQKPKVSTLRLPREGGQGASGRIEPNLARKFGTVSPLAAAGAIGVWQRQQMLRQLREINETAHDMQQDLGDLSDNMTSGSDLDLGGLG